MKLFDIQRGSYVDGPGIRTVIFFKGCNLRCKWCHNPESQRMENQLMFYKDSCTHCGACSGLCAYAATREGCSACGQCVAICPTGARKLCGFERNTEQVMQIIRKDRRYYDKSGGGVTFSGGECLLQPQALLDLLNACHDEGIQTAVDTAGHVASSVIESILPVTDLFLYDIKIMDNQLHQQMTGVGNGQILANLAMLLTICPERVILRVPVIPGINATEANFIALRDFLRDKPAPRQIELLPYHRLGEAKVQALGLASDVYDIPPAELLDKLKKIVEG